MDTNMKTYAQASRDFKLRIVRMYLQDGMSVQRLTETFNIPQPTIYSWSRQYRMHGEMAFIGSGNRREQETDMRRLREENSRLRKENARLRKELAGAAKDMEAGMDSYQQPPQGMHAAVHTLPDRRAGQTWQSCPNQVASSGNEFARVCS